MTIQTVWFALAAFLLAGYVVLDGFDLGVGALHLWVGRDGGERRTLLRTIGAVWDGNEVWLLAAGGTLLFAFPRLLGSSLSGFYLPMTVVLWLLILRALAIELAHHFEGTTWAALADAVFAGASTLLALFFGVALGNVIRGVPLDAAGTFFLPLWTDLGIGGELGAIDWYTLLVGLLAVAALALHGAQWIRLKTEGTLAQRAGRAADAAWWTTIALTGLVTAATFRIQPQVALSLDDRPWGFAFPALALAGLGVIRLSRHAAAARRAFLASSAFLAAMLASAAFGLYPYLLPARGNSALGFTVANASSDEHGLRVALAWWLPGMALAITYATVVYRHLAGKVAVVGPAPDAAAASPGHAGHAGHGGTG